MNYTQAIEKINSLLVFGMQPGLERISKLLSLMGNPQDKLKYIHVAGTNAKGSVCAMLSSVLENAGYKVGLFTSPFVEDFRERIRVNSQMIPKKDLKRLCEYVFCFVDEMVASGEVITEFEFITAMAFKWFYETDCDIVVLETGLGGRFDATNVILAPLVSVITSISLDHTKILGDTLEKIAFEKSGIIKRNCDTLLYSEQDRGVTSLIEKVCLEKGSRLILSEHESINVLHEGIGGIDFEYEGVYYHLPLCGTHQVKNLGVVLSVCKILTAKGFDISTDVVRRGLKTTKIPARIEILSTSPLVILDGSHNRGSGLALNDFIKKHISDKKIILVLGMLKDKDIEFFSSLIASKASFVFTVASDNSRAISPSELADICRRYCDNTVSCSSREAAISKSLSMCDDDTVLLLTGSLYLAGDIRSLLIQKLNELT